MSGAVVDNDVSIGVGLERYTSGGGRGIGDDTDHMSCVWLGLRGISCVFWRGICLVVIHVNISIVLSLGFWSGVVGGGGSQGFCPPCGWREPGRIPMGPVRQ